MDPSTSTASMVLSLLFGAVMVFLMAPRALAMNRGKVLRNIAMWLAIFLGLCLFYKTVGPFPREKSFSFSELLGIAKEKDQDNNQLKSVPMTTMPMPQDSK